MTRKEYIDRYKYRLAAMVLFMQSDDIKAEGAVARASRIYDMPGEIEALLGQMYDENHKPAVPQNGQPAAPAAQQQRK